MFGDSVEVLRDTSIKLLFNYKVVSTPSHSQATLQNWSEREKFLGVGLVTAYVENLIYASTTWHMIWTCCTVALY